MEEKDYLSHTGKDGSDPGYRIEREGYSWKSYGENIAKGQKSVSGVMNAWMNSSGHRKNILSGSKTHFGAGWAKSSNKWTQVFSSTFDEKELCVSANTPTQNPTNSPVSPPTKCEDAKGKFKLKVRNMKTKKMQTYSVKCKKVEKKKYCNNKTPKKERAYEYCPVTCGYC